MDTFLLTGTSAQRFIKPKKTYPFYDHPGAEFYVRLIAGGDQKAI